MLAGIDESVAHRGTFSLTHDAQSLLPCSLEHRLSGNLGSLGVTEPLDEDHSLRANSLDDEPPVEDAPGSFFTRWGWPLFGGGSEHDDGSERCDTQNHKPIHQESMGDRLRAWWTGTGRGAYYALSFVGWHLR